MRHIIHVVYRVFRETRQVRKKMYIIIVAKSFTGDAQTPLTSK